MYFVSRHYVQISLKLNDCSVVAESKTSVYFMWMSEICLIYTHSPKIKAYSLRHKMILFEFWIILWIYSVLCSNKDLIVSKSKLFSPSFKSLIFFQNWNNIFGIENRLHCWFAHFIFIVVFCVHSCIASVKCLVYFSGCHLQTSAKHRI